jgi:signal transduction histidine kinase
MMLQAVAHDVKNKLAELAMRLLECDIEAAALALDAAEKLSHALLFDNPHQLVPHIEARCPIDLAEEMAAVYGQLFPDKNVTADVSAAPTIWFYDIELLRLAISNTMHNACKHGLQNITLRMFVDNDCLVIEIRNDGHEFPEVILTTEWQSTTPLEHASRTHQSISTGIGLLLSHKIVTAHINDKNGQTRHGHLLLSNDHGAVTRLIIP